MYTRISERLNESIRLKQELLTDAEALENLSKLSDEIVRCLKGGGKLVLCGNGGSASDALHFAGEIVGRFQCEREAWPAVVLNADVATLTAIANDYGFDNAYARQAEAFICPGDVFIGISTSGNSENIFRAAEAARKKGAVTAALLGKNGGRLGKIVQIPVIVQGKVTARIQECHITLIHILCELVEDGMKTNE